MKKIGIWLVLLNKRLYKKITYISFLLLIPIFVILFGAVTNQSSGILRVVLVKEDPNDILATQMIEEIQSDSLILSFVEASEATAIDMVAAGKADAAWIFPGDLHTRIQAYARNEKGSIGFVRVVEREQSVPLLLSREKLSGVLHKQVVKDVFLRYIRQIAPETKEIPDQELLQFLNNTDVTGELFDFYDIHGNRREASANYLTTPIRGLLAVVAVICAIVTAMYYQSDLNHGILSLMPEKSRLFGEFGYQMISATNIFIFILLALFVSKLNVEVWKELLLFLMFSVCCALFGMLMRSIFGGSRGLAVLIPVITVVMLTVCPVFLDFEGFRMIQLFFPPTYFVNCAFNNKFFLYLLIYIFVLLFLCLAIYWIKSFLYQVKHISRFQAKETL